jgi:hypothetical protein
MNRKPDPFADPDGHEEWVINEAVERMSRAADRQQSAADRYALAYRDTDREIFSEVMGTADPYEENLDYNEMAAVEDWNGQPMTDEQLLARAMDPDENVLVENSTEYVRERDVDRQNEDLRRQLAQRDQAINNLNAAYNPQYQQQRADARNQFLEANGLMTYDDARADAFANQIQTAQQELNYHRNSRVKDSIESQRAEYGDEAVDQAIADYMRLQGTAIGQSINDHTYASPNPGKTFLSFMHDSDVVESMMGDQHPHMRTGRAPARPPRQSRPSRAPRMQSDDGDYNSGYGQSDVEESIFGSAWE